MARGGTARASLNEESETPKSRTGFGTGISF